MVSLNVFQNDAFSTIQLTKAVEKVPYIPQMLGEMGIFEPNPIRTTMAMVEERQGQLYIIPTSPRGSPGMQRTTEKRKMRAFNVPRLRTSDTLYASELVGIRQFGTETELMQVQSEVARRMGGPTGLKTQIEYTKEYHRFAAIQGLLLDADGSQIYDWFDEFQVNAAAEVGFNLAAGATGTLRGLINDSIIRPMARAAQGAWVPSTRVGALCGDQFYDEFTQHPDVIRTFVNWQEAAELRKNVGAAYGTFEFGGVTWINYRGSDDNTTLKLATDKVKFFPIGAPGVFVETMAVGESFEDLEQPGKEIYARVIPDEKRNEHVELEVSAYPLHICTRPAMLFSGRAEA